MQRTFGADYAVVPDELHDIQCYLELSPMPGLLSTPTMLSSAKDSVDPKGCSEPSRNIMFSVLQRVVFGELSEFEAFHQINAFMRCCMCTSR